MFNAAAHLERAVASVFTQTLRPVDVVLVDDASTDTTREVARRLAAQHPEILVVELPDNQGPAHARNVALDAAVGDWVALLDADDVFTPGRLERMLEVAARESADVVVDNFVFYRARDGALRPSRIPAGDGYEYVDLHRFLRAARPFNYQPVWSLLQPILRAEFLQRHGLRYREGRRHGEDFLLMVDLLLAGARCVRVQNPGYLYTERADGWSTTRLDYADMLVQNGELLRDPRLAGDARARRLVRRRAAALRCLAQPKGRLVSAALGSPEVAATQVRRLGRRVGRLITRPRTEPMPTLL
jgi:succinoglycan biosynthesis protein ExoO